MASLIGILYSHFWIWFYNRAKRNPDSTSNREAMQHSKMLTSFCVVLVLLHAAGLFSNSYIEAQDQVVRFLCSTFMVVYVSI